MQRKILVTAGLPYANGDIHLGHLVEYIQADIWVRYHKLRNHEAHYFCGDDTHGTAVMISAQKNNISPDQWVEQIQKKHIEDFKKFEIEFDHFSSTNTPSNKQLSEEIFLSLQKNGHITVKSVEQAYCEHDKMFLPDRYVKGTCPKCNAKNQYGDSCDSCGSTYSTTELIDAKCSICSNPPVRKSSDHLFFELNHFKEYLQKWVPEHNTEEMSKKLMEWFSQDLRAWDISRDAPYFGFEIPGYKDKYFYVWVDAPIGYIASMKEWADKKAIDYRSFWNDPQREIYHFIGKDIVYFHSLFWPAMLKASDWKSPTQIFPHGMLMVNGEKMSKSKGTFVNAKTFFDHIHPMYLRYYYACKYSSGADDIDLNLSDMVQRVNSDLIGKITNLASRGAQMINKSFAGKVLSLSPESLSFLKLAQDKSEVIAKHYENREFAKAIVEIRALADECNRYFDEKQAWVLIKTDPVATHQVLSLTLNWFRILAIYLKPVLPSYAKEVEKLFGGQSLQWDDIFKPAQDCQIASYQHLATRLEQKQIDAVVEASKESMAAPVAEVNTQNKNKKTETKMTTDNNAKAEVKSEFISIDDFTKIDLRVGEVVEAEEIPEADKLLRLKVKVGDQYKQVFAGIKSKYKASDLLGRKLVIVNNLQPRKMKFGMSEAMILAASAEGEGPFVIMPDEGAKDGFKVK